MTHGLDTGFLVAAEVAEHEGHAAARATLARSIGAGDSLGLAPQVLAEFIHIVTDPRRFDRPVELGAALALAEQWWTAREVARIHPDDDAVRLFLSWLKRYSLGRKRLLDTMLAATYLRAGITSLLTTNPGDFPTFGAFDCITPTLTARAP